MMYNSDHALLACMNFLEVEATELDVGLSLPLQQRARTYAMKIEQISFLASHEVQELLVTFLVSVAASTLEVERRHAQAKRWEAARLTHIATASRDCILRRYWAERAATEAREAVLAADRVKAKKLNKWSVAWQRRPDLLPEGQRFCREGSQQPQARARNGGARASGGRGGGGSHKRHHRGVAEQEGSPQPQALARGGRARASRDRVRCGSHKRQRGEGRSAEMDVIRTYVAEHEASLQTEVQQRRAAIAQRLAAHAAQRRLRVVPSGLVEWVLHLQAHESEFRKRVRAATVERRDRSRRLVAAHDIPEGVPRLQPQAHRWRPLGQGWAPIIWGERVGTL